MFRSAMLVLSSVLVLAQCPVAGAQVSTEVVEVPLIKAFVPQQGFDDNDPNVHAVLAGYLPNACYRLTQAVVERNDAGVPVRVRQMAEFSRDGICAESGALPPHLNELVPFTTEVSLGDARSGRLPAGSYSIAYSYRDRDSEVRDVSRAFTVERALRPTVDNMQYAAVSTAAVPSLAVAGESIVASIVATLTSSCSELTDNVIINRVDDVVVALPTIRVRDSLLCTFMLRDVARSVPIGSFGEGVYLLHVRSKNGHAVNRVFTVDTASARAARRP